ncbi:MAG: tRNA lysidine(34) synthetase TilS [Desulforhopalus sp.]|nr:tRNA lysidine(34) synthetase TilS [Desulforhopalus sp.]
MKTAYLSNKKYRKSSTPQIIHRVATVIRTNRLAVRGDKVVVAVSGGADSLALLHILATVDLQLQLFAVYVNHGLRPLEIPEERVTIARSCQALGVPFFTREVDVQQMVAEEGRSREEAARILRYAALEELRQVCDAEHIAVGHTADDQVEEFFLRLIRGSGMKGLSGMQMRRDTVIRPLLKETKASLVAYLEMQGVQWCQDSSNLDRHILRNRVRLELLPLLTRDFNPAIRHTVLQTMDILREEEDFLQQQMEAAFARCVESSQPPFTTSSGIELIIDCRIFCQLHPALGRRILERCCWQMAAPPSYRQISVLTDLCKGRNGLEIHLEDGVRAERRGSQLILCRPLDKGRTRGSRTPSKTIYLSIPGTGRYTVPESAKQLVIEERPASQLEKDTGGQIFIDLAKVSFPLVLRTSLPGEVFHPCNGPGRKKVSRYLNDRKIPAKDRPAWPVLVSGREIIALPGLQIDHNYRITEETNTMLAISWLEQQG